MRHPPSRSLRLLRSCVALITVWCTGCSGFEPLLDAALGGGGAEMMMCASGSDSVGKSSAGSTEPSDAGRSTTVAAAAESREHPGYDCGCQSCHSVTLATWNVVPFDRDIPRQVALRSEILVSVVRAPLLPPPERPA